MENELNITSIFKESWALFKSNFKKYITISIFVGIVYFAVSALQEGFQRDGGILFFIYTLCAIIVQLYLTASFIRISLRVVDGKEYKFSDIYDSSINEIIWKYLGAAIVIGLLVAVPFAIAFGLYLLNGYIGIVAIILAFLAFVLGVFFVLIRMFMYQFVVVDRKTTPKETVKFCWNMTRGKEWELILYFVLVGLLNFAGAILFGIGLIITIPMTMLATGILFRKMTGDNQSVEVEETPSENMGESTVVNAEVVENTEEGQ